MRSYLAYHVVTERPMQVGQRLVFGEGQYNGVYRRVMEKLPQMEALYAHAERGAAASLEHHTAVALRELALEEVRKARWPHLPSRLACLYVSEQLADAEKWAELFIQWGRPTYHIVKLRVQGGKFAGDANNCFAATLDRQENLRLAERYWENAPNLAGEPPIREILADGVIEVVELVRRIGANVG